MSEDRRIKQSQINADALQHPQPGHIWRERVAVFICVVLDANEFSVLVQRKTRPHGLHHYVIDLAAEPELLTHAQFRELVQYADMNGDEDRRLEFVAEYRESRWHGAVKLLTSQEEVDARDPAIIEKQDFVEDAVWRQHSFKLAHSIETKACLPPPQYRHTDGYHWLRLTTISANYVLAKWSAEKQAWQHGPDGEFSTRRRESWHSLDALL